LKTSRGVLKGEVKRGGFAMFGFRQVPGYFGRFFRSFKGIFSKPQLSNFKRLVCGLIVSEGKNIQGINSVFGERNQSSLNRFVTQSDWDFEEVDRQRLKFTVKHFGSKHDGFIILDDTVAVKTGKKMEKANYHRSGVTKKKEWGHCFVDSLYFDTDSDVTYPIRIQSYLRKVNADSDNPFKTKREIALEQIDFALENGVRAGGVMSDAWYYSDEFVKELKTRNLKYFLGVKTSLKISINRQKRISIKKYIETLQEKDFTKHKFKNGTYFLHNKEASIRGDGKETLLISYKQEEKNNIKCYVTNCHEWDNFKYMKVLLKRWSIECLHRDTKQHLGLEEYQVRKYRGMQAVALAILAAYTLLILNKAPALLKKFRPLQTIGEMCRFTQLCTQKTTYWLKKTFNDFNTGRKILNQHILVKNAKV